MMKRILIPAMILAILMLCAACGPQSGETTLPAPTETTTAPTAQTVVPTAEPVTEATTVPTTEPVTEPITEPTEPPHVHSVGYTLEDYEGHGYVCQCGAEILAPHMLDDEGKCTVCDVYVRMEENGHYVVTKQYDDVGLVSIDQFFKPLEDGSDGFYRYLMIQYYSDGERGVVEYGTHGHITSLITYRADGTVAYLETRTYEFYEDGSYDLDCFWDGVLYQERSYIYGPDGRHHETLLIDYNMSTGEPDRIVIYEYEIGETIQMIHSRVEDVGYGSIEKFYEKNEAGEYYLARHVSYDQDGNITEETHYNEAGRPIRP